MYRRTGRWSVAAALMLALLPCSTALAADPEAPAKPPMPEQVLREMSAYLAKQSALAYHAEIEFDKVLPGGPKIRLSGALDLVAARPGNLFVDYRDDVSERVVWFDAGIVTVFDPAAGTFATVETPKTIDAMVSQLEKEVGLTLPLAEFAESDPYAVLTRDVELAHYVGVHDVEGVMCHHVYLHRPDLDLQVFVEVGDKPLPRKIVFDYPNLNGSPQYTASITEWSLEAPKAEVFSAKLPEGVAKVEFVPVEGL